MGIRDRPIAPGNPWQNAYVERLIGSIRRECLDHLIIVNKGHLRRAFSAHGTYYNTVRTHLASRKDAPLGRPSQRNRAISRTPQSTGCITRSFESDKRKGQALGLTTECPGC